MISISFETCSNIDQNECVLVNVFRLNVFWSKNADHFSSEIVLQSINTLKSMRFYQLNQDHHTYCVSKFDHETSNNLLSFNHYYMIVVCESWMSWILFLIVLLLMRFVIIKYFVNRQRFAQKSYCSNCTRIFVLLLQSCMTCFRFSVRKKQFKKKKSIINYFYYNSSEKRIKFSFVWTIIQIFKSNWLSNRIDYRICTI